VSIGDIDLKKVSPDDIQSLYQKMTLAGAKPVTVHEGKYIIGNVPTGSERFGLLYQRLLHQGVAVFLTYFRRKTGLLLRACHIKSTYTLCYGVLHGVIQFFEALQSVERIHIHADMHTFRSAIRKKVATCNQNLGGFDLK